MKKFAKVIETKAGQVLVTLDSVDDSDEVDFTLRTDIEGFTVTSKLTCDDISTAEDRMETYNVLNAEAFIKRALDLLS